MSMILLNKIEFDRAVFLCRVCALGLEGTVMGSPEQTSTSEAMDAFYLRMNEIGKMLSHYGAQCAADVDALEAAGKTLSETDQALASQIAG